MNTPFFPAGGAGGPAQELLASIVDVARRIFLAQAASIALLDPARGEFVFLAVSGEGAGEIEGRGFPRGEGIAGAVAQTGEPLILDDLAGDPRFARRIAEGTGYVPRAMMVVPLLGDEDVLGVLSVLDRGATGRTSLQELELLAAFATQAAIALRVIAAGSAGGSADVPEVAALAARIGALEGERRRAAADVLRSLERIL